MDSFEFNKIAGAVLAALLVIVGTKEIINMTSSDEDHGGQHAAAGFELPAPASQTKAAAAGASHGAAAPAAPAGFDAKAVVAMLGKANADAGKAVFKKCKACHTSNSGGANRVGPNLWNVVGRKKGSAPGFKYSAAMSAKGGEWSFEDLAAFLHKPKTFIKGTKMSFGGIKANADLANLVVYLRSLSDKPAALPK